MIFVMHQGLAHCSFRRTPDDSVVGTPFVFGDTLRRCAVSRARSETPAEI